jgi:hypothetical protein
MHFSQIGDVGQHDRVSDQGGVFELLFLFDRIAALSNNGSDSF